MTLSRLVFAGDVGLGLGHAPYGGGVARRCCTGLGMNVEGALGITDRLEIGLRGGFPFGYDGQVSEADYFARTNWTETYGAGRDLVGYPKGDVSIVNPEARVRWDAYQGSIAEVGLDGRLFLPVETGTRFGFMAGVPVAFHVADFLRIDTGVYLPVVLPLRTFYGISIPAYVWFQPTKHLWLGPMAQLRVIDRGSGSHDAKLTLGLGLGYQVSKSVDLKSMGFLPGGPRNFGVGLGVQFRIGE